MDNSITWIPEVMLCTEPIVYCFALYDGLDYAIIVSRFPLIDNQETLMVTRF